MAARLGVVAGRGDLASRFIDTCRAAGRAPFVLALEGQASRQSFKRPPDAWIGLGEIGRGLEILRRADVEELVFVGGIRRPALTELRPDAWTARFIVGAGRALFGDDSALSAILRAIEAEGFRIVAPEAVVEDLIARPGAYGALAPDREAAADIALGLKAARAIGALDIGQAAVVQRGRVLGLEAAEGTDALIARAGALQMPGPGGILVKAAKPGQDRRIDLPTIGVDTVNAAAAAGLRGIAVEAGGTLVVDGAAIGAAADRAGMFVIGVAAGE